MAKQPLIIVMGIAGCGKSHACKRLDPSRFYYVSYDGNRNKYHLDMLRACPKDKVAVYDLNIKTSTFIKRHSDEFDIRVVGIGKDKITSRANLLSRGGKFTRYFYSRWKVMQRRFKSYAEFVALDGDEAAQYINSLDISSMVRKGGGA